MNLLIGTKYQTFIDDESVIFRLLKIENDKYIFLDKNNKKVSIDTKEVESFAKINIDAVMNIMITKSDDGAKDVYICINKTSDLVNGIERPSMILRQDIYSISKNTLSLDSNVYVGECFTTLTAPSDEAFNELMDFTEIDHSFSIGLYVDDTMNEISMLIKYISKDFDKALVDIKKSHKEQIDSGIIKGYCENLTELMNSNNFITNFRMMFNIAQLDFPIRLDNNCSEDGVITLNRKQLNKLQGFLAANITDVSVLKYDKDIDISKLIRNNHMMVSDINGEIFLINYTIVYRYTDEDTSDIVEAMTNILNG